MSVRKIILSADPIKGSDFTVVAVFKYVRFILFIKPGEKNWSWFDRTEARCMDAIFCDGKLLTLTDQGEMAAVDLRIDPPSRTLLSNTFFAEYDIFQLRYLVADSVGDMLQICRHTQTIQIEGEGYYMIEKTEVLRLDHKYNTWSPVKSLGEQSLFVGNSYSTALTSCEIPGLKKNHVYFTDGGWNDYSETSKTSSTDVGVYSLEDDRIESCTPLGLQLKWPPQVWFTPVFRRN